MRAADETAPWRQHVGSLQLDGWSTATTRSSWTGSAGAREVVRRSEEGAGRLISPVLIHFVMSRFVFSLRLDLAPTRSPLLFELGCFPRIAHS